MNRVAMLAPLAALCLIATAAHAQTPAKTASAQPAFVLSSLDTKFTGDLDGMIKRRLIRILAPYSKTFYFVDRGVQRGLIYEISEILERDLNKRLKTGNVRVHVAIIPMSHDEFVPALREGRGASTNTIWRTRCWPRSARSASGPGRSPGRSSS